MLWNRVKVHDLYWWEGLGWFGSYQEHDWMLSNPNNTTCSWTCSIRKEELYFLNKAKWEPFSSCYPPVPFKPQPLFKHTSWLWFRSRIQNHTTFWSYSVYKTFLVCCRKHRCEIFERLQACRFSAHSFILDQPTVLSVQAQVGNTRMFPVHSGFPSPSSPSAFPLNCNPLPPRPSPGWCTQCPPDGVCFS